MPATRPTEAIETLRCNFTDEEKLTMGRELAEAHNSLAELDEDEKVLKAQMKEKRAIKEAKVNCLARELASGFTMRPVKCRLVYDDPNANEVSTYRTDNEELVKTRAFTLTERQADLPLAGDVVVVAPVEGAESEANIAEFFGDAEAVAAESQVDERTDDEPADDAEPIEYPPVELRNDTAPAEDPLDLGIDLAGERERQRREENAAVLNAKRNLAKM